MNTKLFCAIAGGLIMAGCVSTPVPNAALENARTMVRSTEADPNVTRYAPLELESAKKELAVAESASLQHDDAAIDQPAYLAAQTAHLAQLRATAKADDARVAASQAERAQIQLDARGREVNNANAANDQAAAKAAALKAELEALKVKRAKE